MGIRIKCGRHPNDEFSVSDSETGEDLTSKLLMRDLDVLVSLAPGTTNVARMDVYAESVDVLVDRVEVTIVDEGRSRPDADKWKNHDIRLLSEEISRLSSRFHRFMNRSEFSEKPRTAKPLLCDLTNETREQFLERAIEFSLKIDDHYDRIEFLETVLNNDTDIFDVWPEFIDIENLKDKASVTVTKLEPRGTENE